MSLSDGIPFSRARRDFLRFSLSLGAGAAACSSGAPSGKADVVPAKSVIWLWMDGGQSQTDTWDPKSEGPFKAIETSVGGIRISELLPRCAARMDRIAIVRSMSTHEIRPPLASWLMHVGFLRILDAPYPPIGTVLARDLGRKGFPLPGYIAIDPGYIPDSNLFPQEFRPYRVTDLSNPFPDARRTVEETRSRAREQLLAEQTAEWERGRVQKVTKAHQAAAAAASEIMASELLNAFDLTQEPDDLVRLYGPGFGRRCLLARRLVEAGCPFVEVGLHGWGLQDDYFPAVRRLCESLDAGLGALLTDLGRTGLLDETLIVCAGPHGRAPSAIWGSREPTAKGWSVVLAGGPIQGGRVHGDTGPKGVDCVPPVSASTLFNTIYTACGINPHRRLGVGDCVDRYTYPYGPPLNDLLRR